MLQESFVQPLLNPNFYSGITTETDSEWETSHNGKNVSESIKGYLVDYLGKPLVHLLRWGSTCCTLFTGTRDAVECVTGFSCDEEEKRWERWRHPCVCPPLRGEPIKMREIRLIIYIYCYPRRLKFCHNIKESTLNWAWPSCYIVKSGALFRAFATSLLFTGTLPLLNHYVCIKRARNENVITLYWR